MMTVDYQPNKAANISSVSEQTSLDITVAIPTYNGANRIPQVLDQLKQQLDVKQLTWEVIVCDNNSCDRTADVVANYQITWLQGVPLRYCFVAEQGAAFARQRAVEKARGEIVAFLDDDNIPALEWLSNVYRFAKAYPQAGAFGSQIHGDFQGELPSGFGHIACFLAIVERGNKPHLYNPESKILPPAAGLAVRRTAWIEAVPERLFLNHKGKSAGLASEDLEAMLHIQKAGWEIWYNSDMVVTHKIPEKRLQQDYLIALLRCIGLSRFYIRWLGTKDWQRFFKVPAYIANDLRKLALHYLKNGPPQTNWDTVTACERSLLTSTLVSPAFLLKKAYQDFWQDRLDNTQLPKRRQWLQRLTDAFEDRQFELYRQAVISADSLVTTENGSSVTEQYEILLRLRYSASDGPLAEPPSFLPTAERYGLMRTIDRRVIQQVCETLSAVSDETIYSINLSTASVHDSGFINWLAEQIHLYQVSSERLCFEVQESVLIKSWPVATSLIEHIKVLGLQVAIDEITVYDVDRFTELTKLSVDYFKLSASMTAGENPSLMNWIQFAQKHGTPLVAKGVESKAQLEQLQSLGIQYLQGYYVSKPTTFI